MVNSIGSGTAPSGTTMRWPPSASVPPLGPITALACCRRPPGQTSRGGLFAGRLAASDGVATLEDAALGAVGPVSAHAASAVISPTDRAARNRDERWCRTIDLQDTSGTFFRRSGGAWWSARLHLHTFRFRMSCGALHVSDDAIGRRETGSTIRLSSLQFARSEWEYGTAPAGADRHDDDRLGLRPQSRSPPDRSAGGTLGVRRRLSAVIIFS